MAIKKHEPIPICDLVIDGKNPRFFPVDNEAEAIMAMLVDQGRTTGTNKIVELAKDIAENGLNPSEEIVVMPLEGGKYLVREGNRRTTAMKLSLHPELIPEDFGALEQVFSSYQEAMKKVEPRCYITDDEEEILRIIEVRHSGAQSGVGVIRWNTEQNSRFKQMRAGRPDKLIALIDQLSHQFTQRSDPYRDLAKIPKTNLGRYLSTPAVREDLRVVLEDGVYVYKGGVDAFLAFTLQELAKRRVSEFYYSDQRVEMSKKILQEYKAIAGDDSVYLSEGQGNFFGDDNAGNLDDRDSSDYGSTNNGEENGSNMPPGRSVDGFSGKDIGKEKGGPAPVGYPDNRVTVIPRNHAMHTMNEARIAAVHKELKNLNAEEFPNAASLMLRTLIQLCVDKYLVDTEDEKAYDKKLSARIDAACRSLVASKKLNNNDVDVLRKMASNNDSFEITVSSLNASAHSPSWVAPKLKELKSLWDGIYKVLAAMVDDRGC